MLEFSAIHLAVTNTETSNPRVHGVKDESAHSVEAECHHCSTHGKEGEASGACRGDPSRISDGWEAAGRWTILEHGHVFDGLQWSTQPGFLGESAEVLAEKPITCSSTSNLRVSTE